MKRGNFFIWMDFEEVSCNSTRPETSRPSGCWALSQVRICRLLPPPFRIAPIFKKVRTVLNRMKNQFSDFFQFIFFELWQFTIYQIFNDKKKSFTQVVKFTGKMSIALKMIFWFMSFFYTTFSFWDMVNLVHGRFWSMQKT